LGVEVRPEEPTYAPRPCVGDGRFNTATGAAALWSNTTGAGNTATGYSALWHNINGGSNTAIGFQALFSNTSGGGHTAVGSGALQNSHAGGLLCFGNTAIGLNALNNSTSGCGNTALGRGAGHGVTTGGGNTLIGVIAGSAVTSANNVIAVGTAGGNVSNSCYIGNIWQEPAGGIQVYVNSDGKLGYRTSSRRFKDEIKPMEQASEVIYRLQPVSFRYKPEIEPTRPLGFGLIAEDVQKISPDLVTRGGDGKVNTVDYDAVNAMLLNEFLKEHRTVQDLKSTVAKQEGTIARQRKDFETSTARQQKQLQALTATLNEQAAQLQKVSTQIEVSKFATGRIRRGGPAPQTVVNNQ